MGSVTIVRVVRDTTNVVKVAVEGPQGVPGGMATLADVNITSLISGNLLTWNGTDWVNGNTMTQHLVFASQVGVQLAPASGSGWIRHVANDSLVALQQTTYKWPHGNYFPNSRGRLMLNNSGNGQLAWLELDNSAFVPRVYNEKITPLDGDATLFEYGSGKMIVAGSTVVYMNGQRLRPTDDYSVFEGIAGGEITFVKAPEASDEVYLDYSHSGDYVP